MPYILDERLKRPDICRGPFSPLWNLGWNLPNVGYLETYPDFLKGNQHLVLLNTCSMKGVAR